MNDLEKFWKLAEGLALEGSLVRTSLHGEYSVRRLIDKASSRVAYFRVRIVKGHVKYFNLSLYSKPRRLV
jgi:hypothetical protein